VGRTLNEHDSKLLLAAHGVPVMDERVVATAHDAVVAAEELGAPVVLKLVGDGIAHKTERGLVRLSLRTAGDVEDAASDLLASARPDDGEVALLVAPMVKGSRELIAGIHRDERFGPCVMVGVGGVAAEAVADVAFRLVPIEPVDALEMLDDLHARDLFDAFRGEPALDREALARVLTGLSSLAESRPDVVSVDVNPLIVSDGQPVAVDALVELEETPS
jgi:acetate---CoA ligase (ADP-forming) subunit beta